jgi:hypothetical protein
VMCFQSRTSVAGPPTVEYVWPTKRMRLSFALVFTIMSLMTLGIMLIDGHRWYGWLLVVTMAGMALVQVYEIRKSQKVDPS